jgi:hypothetical protein
MRASPKSFSRGAEISHKTITRIPADAKLRPLRDQLIVEPLDGDLSAILIIIHERKPVTGIVKAVGPGCWLKQYATGTPPTWCPTYAPPSKGSRTMVRDSKIFRPTKLKVGDRVDLGGHTTGGYAFDTFYWGDTLHLFNVREEDVTFVYPRDRHAAA